jgi:hypothetical protein
VVAGPTESTLDGGLVRALRSDSALDAVVSTVDNAHRAVGRSPSSARWRAAARRCGRYGGAGGAMARPVEEPSRFGEPSTPSPGDAAGPVALVVRAGAGAGWPSRERRPGGAGPRCALGAQQPPGRAVRLTSDRRSRWPAR